MFQAIRIISSWFFLLILNLSIVYAQLNVNDQVETVELLQALLGPGVSIENIQISCPNGASGIYTLHDESNTSRGVILSTGLATQVQGPNDEGYAGTSLAGPGDRQLSQLAGSATQDACIIEFDVIPLGTELRFKYTFGSEEYPNIPRGNPGFQCNPQNYNDVFAFYISGPGIMGEENIALIPGTSQAVSINNVNNDPQCNGDNSQYYVDNTQGNILEFNGYTQNLVAKVSVQACEKYHLKLKIADVADAYLDSGVLIEQVTSNYADIGAIFSANTQKAIEGCVTVDIPIRRVGDISSATVFDLTYGGTARANRDYPGLPQEINFQAGEAVKTLSFIPLEDNLREAPENFKMYIEVPCGGPILDSLVLDIYDKASIQAISNQSQRAIYCGETLNLEAEQGDTYTWESTEGNLTCEDCQVLQVKPQKPTYYKATVQIGSCTFVDSVLVSPDLLDLTSNTAICLGDSLRLRVSGRDQYQWSPSESLSCKDCDAPIAFPNASTTYYVQAAYADGSCQIMDSVEVIVQSPPDIWMNVRDGYCINAEPLDLEANPKGGVFTVNYEITNLFDPNTWGLGRHLVEYEYVDAVGCVTLARKFVTVYANPEASIELMDTVFCWNDLTVPLLGEPEGGVFTIQGEVVDALTPNTLQPGKYKIIYTYTDISNCTASDFKTITITEPTELGIEGLNPNYCLENAPISIQGQPSQGIFLINDQVVFSDNYILAPQQLGVGEHVISYVGSSPCDTLHQTIRIHPLVSLPEISEEQRQICVIRGEKKILDAGIGVSYEWNSTQLSRPEFTRTLVVEKAGIYTISVTDSLGCRVVSEIEVEEYCSPRLYVPEAFSPNGDGLNDTFKIFGSAVKDFKIIIQNHWGEVVFSSQDLSEEWNGIYKGKPAPVGVYVCQIQYRPTSKDRLRKERSSVTLLR